MFSGKFIFVQHDTFVYMDAVLHRSSHNLFFDGERNGWKISDDRLERFVA
jgi:hypothetical protein